MRPLRLAAAAALVVPAVTAVTAAPAHALSITAPGSTNLGSVSGGQTLSGQLGAVTVSSNAAVALGWSATVTLSSQFTVTQGGQSATLPAARVKYWSGSATASSGLGATICLPGQPTSVTSVTLTASRTAYSCAALLSTSSSLTWNPTLVITTQAGDPAGTYSGTITHSVA